MSDSARRDLAIQTYCLRGFTDSRVVAQKVAELGLAHIELAGNHAGDTDPFLEAGIGIVSTGVVSACRRRRRRDARDPGPRPAARRGAG